MNISKTTLVPIIILLLIASFVPACSPFNPTEQLNHSDLALLHGDQNLGQSFVARYDGLNAVDIFIKPDINASGQLNYTLWDGAEGSSHLLAQSTLDISEITNPGVYSLSFSNQKSSNNKYYYLKISVAGGSQLFIGVNDESAYYNGSLYVNDQPIDLQLAFTPQYHPLQLLIGLLKDGLLWQSILLVGIWLFVLPGWSILSVVLKNWNENSWGVKLGLSSGTSIAIYPVLFLWTDSLGIHLGALYGWIPPLAGLILIVWRNRLSLRRSLTGVFQHTARSKWRNELGILIRTPKKWAPDFLLLLSILLLFASRFWHIRNLDAPMWGDSYQHTMMAQLLVDNAGLFTNWEPYVPYYSLTVHFGFPVTVALVKWITGLPVEQATLVTGQLLNGLAIVALIPLAKRFAPNSRWAGIGVIIFAGFFTLMPAYYVNWGRYAQLAGQAILPAAIWLVWEAVVVRVNRGNFFWQRDLAIILVAGMVCAGMFLTYYRMVFFFAAFIFVWLILWGLLFLKSNIHQWIATIIVLGSVALVSLLLVLPWLPKLRGSTLSQAVESGVLAGSSLSNVIFNFQVWRDITQYYPIALLFLGIFVFIWAAIKTKWILFILPLWYGLLIAYISSEVVHVPGANMLQNFTLLISLYIPFGLAIGWLFDSTAQYAEERGLNMAITIIPIIFLAMGLFGVFNIRTISNPDTYALVFRPDTRAMSWIRENITGNSRFLVEGFRTYGGSSAVGSDAGWWISLLAKRQNSMPPQYALSNEIPNPPDYSQAVVDLVDELEYIPIDSPEAIPVLCQHRITHVYIGQGQGKVGAGANQLFTPSQLSNNKSFDLVYNQDKVFIYALLPDTCDNNS